jgi:hypothetical protein
MEHLLAQHLQIADKLLLNIILTVLFIDADIRLLALGVYLKCCTALCIGGRFMSQLGHRCVPSVLDSAILTFTTL